MTHKRAKFVILLGLFSASCMTANDKTTCEENMKTIHDTITVAQRDTLRIKDTVKIQTVKWDTLRILDTLKVHDTTRITLHDTILASLPDPSNLFGVWSGAADGKDITIAFTSTAITIHAADFSATIGGAPQSGYIGQVDSAQAKVTWGGFHDVTWIMDLRDGTLKIQEVGERLFPEAGVSLRKR